MTILKPQVMHHGIWHLYSMASDTTMKRHDTALHMCKIENISAPSCFNMDQY